LSGRPEGHPWHHQADRTRRSRGRVRHEVRAHRRARHGEGHGRPRDCGHGSDGGADVRPEPV